ncbi:hypothetical protein ACH492_36920 [Streptomyces sp. NPDC019443]|uniref:hypothetical protein n=1 Tax=Streptomyces sp. NPDC019443 TaxID=3365061 RepID=UPI0037BC12C1
MTDLVNLAVEAHGGLERWQSAREVAIDGYAAGPAFTSKFQSRTLREMRAQIATSD